MTEVDLEDIVSEWVAFLAVQYADAILSNGAVFVNREGEVIVAVEWEGTP